MLDDDQLRAWFAKQLKVPDIPLQIWEEMHKAGYLRHAHYDEEERADTLREMKRWIRWSSVIQGRPMLPRRAKQEEVEGPQITLSDYERERALALSDYLAMMADTAPRVCRFREQVLGEKLLTFEQARAFVTSLALAHFSRQQCADWRIPLVGHTASRVGHERDDLSATGVNLWVDPPGETFAVPDQDGSARARLAGRRKFVEYPGEDGTRMLALYMPGSVLQELYDASEPLVNDYPWQAEQAVWFVLTGAVPFVSPHRARSHMVRTKRWSRNTIILTVEPWVPAERVLKAYRQSQREALGGDNRPISRRNIALFRFVTERMDAQGNGPPWREVMRDWNAEHPEWRYEDLRNLARDFRRAERAILWPID